jgi:hypothetical protein
VPTIRTGALKRRPPAFTAAALAVLACIAVSGCGGLPAFGGGTFKPATPRPVYPHLGESPAATTGTVAPTLAPPTPGATARPTDKAATSAQAFRRHLIGTQAESRRVFPKLVRALKAKDVARVLKTLKPVREWASGEQKWLDEHPPQDCYRPLYVAWSAAFDKYAEAFSLLYDAVEENDAVKANLALRALNTANATLDGYDGETLTTLCAD